MATLQIQGIRKDFQGSPVLRGLDIDCADGEMLVLVGPSGCGKSTLLNIIAGLEPPTAGTVRLGGRDVTRLSPRERNVAMVFQSYALYPTMTVRDNIAFALELRGIAKSERQAAVERVAKMLQIEALLGRKPAQLSGGQRQRVAMGRALVRDPALFLFDEPLSNLDAKLRVEMRLEIKRLHQRLGTTAVYVTHDQVEAMTLATRVAVMKDGIVQQIGAPNEIYATPANMFVASFMGSPAMNFLPAKVRRDAGGALALEIDDAVAPLRLTEAQMQRVREGDEVVAGIRPENLGAAAGPEGAVLEGRVDVVEPTGPDALVTLRVGEVDVTARVAPSAAPRAGELAQYSVDMERLVLFERGTGRALGPAPG
jgi:multiple sugar transport system ATP-binding protein